MKTIVQLVEQKGFACHIMMTASECEETAVDDSKFSIPEFSEVTANPMN